jgi:hypothetical protein
MWILYTLVGAALAFCWWLSPTMGILVTLTWMLAFMADGSPGTRS